MQEEEVGEMSSGDGEKKMDPWDMAVLKEREKQRQKHKVGLLIQGKFQIDAKIGFGTFGSIYSAHNVETGEAVAVKFEFGDDHEPKSHLRDENKVYQCLGGCEGIPRLHWYGSEFGYNIMVLDLLGPNLEQLMRFCDYSFTLKTLLLLADQMLNHIQNIHNSGFIHRDIKPANFLIGIGPDSNKLFLIDYGLAKQYREAESSDHVPFREGRSLIGTARYASLNAHLGRELGRRDDLEALGYVLISFKDRSGLPWQNMNTKTKAAKYNRILRMKRDTNPERLCHGLPREFVDYMRYCKELAFEAEPDYDYLKGLFRSLAKKRQIEYDYVYDWNSVARNSPEKRDTWDVLFKWTRDVKGGADGVEVVKEKEVVESGPPERMLPLDNHWNWSNEQSQESWNQPAESSRNWSNQQQSNWPSSSSSSKEMPFSSGVWQNPYRGRRSRASKANSPRNNRSYHNAGAMTDTNCSGRNPPFAANGHAVLFDSPRNGFDSPREDRGGFSRLGNSFDGLPRHQSSAQYPIDGSFVNGSGTQRRSPFGNGGSNSYGNPPGNSSSFGSPRFEENGRFSNSGLFRASNAFVHS